MKKAIDTIREAGVVTTAIRKSYFNGKAYDYIRNWLEEHGLDRHLPIELDSTEIALITPSGIIMQIRSSDNNQLGLWGGAICDGETPREGALRELKEETGLEFPEQSLEFVEFATHTHKYSNGDNAIFHTYRFKVVLDYVPNITTNEESTGICIINHTVLDCQQDFLKRLLGEKK